MAKKTGAKGFETVREIGLALPEVIEATSWGSPALKVRGRTFVVIPTHREAEPNSLAVMLSFDDRDALIEEAPDIYYLKDHYVNYPCVLVRLSRIRRDALEDLIRASWAFERQNATKKAGRAGRAAKVGGAGTAGRTGAAGQPGRLRSKTR